MGVDLGRADVFVAQEFLDRADVIAAFEQMGREAVTEAVTGRALRHASLSRGDADRALYDCLMKMMAPPLAGWLVEVGSGGREYPLPPPVVLSAREFSSQCVWEFDVAASSSEVVFKDSARAGQLSAKHGHDTLNHLPASAASHPGFRCSNRV
jgi:hypothetical protein